VLTSGTDVGFIRDIRGGQVFNRISKLLLLSCILLFQPLGVAKDQTGTVKGTVVDATGAALFRARILLVEAWTLEEKKAEVQLNGNFVLEHLPVGDYVLMIATPTDIKCFDPVLNRVQLRPEETVKLTITMQFNTQKCPEVVE